MKQATDTQNTRDSQAKKKEEQKTSAVLGERMEGDIYVDRE